MIPIFSDIQNRIFDFEVAALDMMNFEWSYIFPRSRINLPFAVSFIFLGDIGEKKIDSWGHFERSYLQLTARSYNFEIWARIALVST